MLIGNKNSYKNHNLVWTSLAIEVKCKPTLRISRGSQAGCLAQLLSKDRGPFLLDRLKITRKKNIIALNSLTLFLAGKAWFKRTKCKGFKVNMGAGACLPYNVSTEANMNCYCNAMNRWQR